MKIYSIKPLYLSYNKVNEYFGEINGNKYLALVPTNESKEKIKKYEKLWSKTRDLIRSKTKSSDDYYEKYMKIKFNWDNKLPQNKTIEIPTMTVLLELFFMKIINIRKFSEMNVSIKYKNGKKANMNCKKLILKIVHVIILMI